MEGVIIGLTCMIMELLTAVWVVAQLLFDVSVQVIISPLTIAAEVNVFPVAMLVPFFFHW